MVKNIIQRIIVGIGVALALMFLKGNLVMVANAKSLYYTVPRITMVTSSDSNITRDTTAFTSGDNSRTYYGYVSQSNPSNWHLFRFHLTAPSTATSGLKNVSYVFYNGFTDNYNMYNMFTFTIIDNQNHIYSCTSDASNCNGTTPSGYHLCNKQMISVICPNVYFDKNYNYYVDINMNDNASTYTGTWGITRPTFTDTEGGEIQSAINETNDLINDSSIDENNTSSSINTMNSQLASNNSITQLLTLPIQLYQSILNSINGSCSSFNLGTLYNHSITLPCINLQSLLGSTLYGIIDILISGLFILSFRKKMVDIFNHMTSLNDRGNEVE